jgi:hypothetical protein
VSTAFSRSRASIQEVPASSNAQMFTDKYGTPLKMFIHPAAMQGMDMADLRNKFEGYGMLVDTVALRSVAILIEVT